MKQPRICSFDFAVGISISIGYRMDASAIKELHYKTVENYVKITRAFRRVQFERIIKYHE